MTRGTLKCQKLVNIDVISIWIKVWSLHTIYVRQYLHCVCTCHVHTQYKYCTT